MIHIRNVSKKYGDKVILHDINLTINRGEVTFIVGTSGAGKTTLLNLIGGLDKPNSGEVLLDGIDIQDDLNDYRSRHVGFVFQDSNLIPGLTITQNVEIAAALAGTSHKVDAIRQEITALGISDPDQSSETLSGGERQRAAVIRGICKNAEIIIADEPTGNLDSKNAELVLDLLRSRKAGKYILIVSHDLEKAQQYADRIIKLGDGVVISDQTIAHEPDISTVDPIGDKQLDARRASPRSLTGSLMLGLNSVKRRHGKIISIAIALALAIASLAAVFSLNASGREMTHNVNVNYLESDLISLYYNYTANTGFMEMPFSEDDLQWIQNSLDLKTRVPLYLVENQNWLFSAAGKTAGVCLKQIQINDFFAARVMSNAIEGRFLKTKDEIIIAEDVARLLYDGDCIGQPITINDGRGNSKQLTIVGINHTVNPTDEIFSFVSADAGKDLLSSQLTATIFQRQELNTFLTAVQNMRTGGLYGSMKVLDPADQLLYGQVPAKAAQIMISSELLSNVLSEFDIVKAYTPAEVASGQISSDDLEKIFAKKLALNYNGLFAVYVSGIYTSDKIEMSFSDQLIQAMLQVDPVVVDVYLAEPAEVADAVSRINRDAPFAANSQMETLKANVSMQTRFFGIALILLGFILALISLALLSSFTKISVLERKNEVAILKSIGARSLNIWAILLFDALVITLYSILLAMVFGIAISSAWPLIMPKSAWLTSAMPLLQTFTIGLVFALIVLILTGLNLRKIVTKMPAELLIQ